MLTLMLTIIIIIKIYVIYNDWSIFTSLNCQIIQNIFDNAFVSIYNSIQDNLRGPNIMSKQVYPVNQLRVFINTINDLSADILLQEALDDFNAKLYEEKIEESLVEKDEEKFNTYTALLREITDDEN